MHFVGLGTSVPEHSIEQHDAAELASAMCCPDGSRKAVLAQLYRKSGVQRRHSTLLGTSTNGSPANQSFYAPATQVDLGGPTTAERMTIYESDASALALGAARNALDDAAVKAQEISHLVTVSCTGFHAPGVDLLLCEQLNLPPSVQRTHIGFMGCHAAINALRVADAFAASDPESCVLMCAVELCSLHYQYGWCTDHVVANSLFADGAAALVGRRRPDERQSWARTVASGTCRVPNSADLMSWRIGNHGFRMTLSPQVPSIISEELQQWMIDWLDSLGLQIGDIAAWAIHPGGPRILDACAQSLCLADEQVQPSRSVLARYGNMSSATVLFVLDEIRQTCSDGYCVLLAFGPGLTAEAALIEFC